MTPVPRPWEDLRVIEGLPRQFEARRRLLDAGALRVGWKVGFGAPASLQLMGISAPLLGFLTDATELPSGAEIDAAGWERGIVEFEVAVSLGADVAPGATSEEAARAVAAVGPAIELANIDLPVEAGSVSDIVAGNIFHEYVIFGMLDPERHGLDISGLVAHVTIDGSHHSTTTDLQAMTGTYADIVTTVASTVASQGEVLRAGDVIITGSVIAPIPITAGSEFRFTLDPLPPITTTVHDGP